MPGDREAELGGSDPPRLQMLMAQHYVCFRNETADERSNAHEAAGQHLEQMFAESRTDLDLQSRLLTHLAPERRTMFLARIGPAARQIPFIAFVQEQQSATVVDDDAFHRKREIAHRLVAVP